MRFLDFCEDDFVTVSKCRLFDGCNEQDVRRFLNESGVTVRSFSGRELIPHEARLNCWGIVLTGSVRIYSGTDGGHLLINVVGSQQPFDIAALSGYGDGKIISDAWTVGKCRLAFIAAINVERLTLEYPKVAANCMAFFCERIGFLNRKLHTLSRRNAEHKLADFLLSEFTTEDGKAIVRVKSCVEVAVRLNLSRASLYRAFGILEKSGCILHTGKQIEILDISTLQSV